jgi:hypothetical protein
MPPIQRKKDTKKSLTIIGSPKNSKTFSQQIHGSGAIIYHLGSCSRNKGNLEPAVAGHEFPERCAVCGHRRGHTGRIRGPESVGVGNGNGKHRRASTARGTAGAALRLRGGGARVEITPELKSGLDERLKANMYTRECNEVNGWS